MAIALEVTRKMESEKSKRALVELFNQEIFSALPNYLSNLMAEGPARMVIRESMRHAIVGVLEQNKEIRDWINNEVTLEEKFNMCYELYKELGLPFKYEIEKSDDKSLIIKVTECPHIKYTKENPVACSACDGLKLGILDEVFGIHLSRIKSDSNMANGDEFCRFEFPMIPSDESD